MKKKLLITMGCSLTEGVGCYDFSFNPDKNHYFDLPEELMKIQRSIFHKEGWPNRVGKKLGYDKVLNIGLAGSSNSAHLKLFVDKILPKINYLKEEFDILIIWMMTAPSRFSFYSNKGLQLFTPAETKLPPLFPEPKNLEAAYIRDMPEVEIGPLREQIFLIKVSYNLFKNLGVKFLYTSWSEDFKEVYRYVKFNNYLSPIPSKIDYYRSPSDQCTLSKHPNSNGYEYISLNIIQSIKKFHPYISLGTNSGEIDWEYLGFPDYELEPFILDQEGISLI